MIDQLALTVRALDPHASVKLSCRSGVYTAAVRAGNVAYVAQETGISRALEALIIKLRKAQ